MARGGGIRGGERDGEANVISRRADGRRTAGRQKASPFEFQPRPRRLGYAVFRKSDGRRLGVVLPAPGRSWTVKRGDGRTYPNLRLAAEAMARRRR